MYILSRSALAVAAYATTAFAAVSYSPITSGPSYQVSIPQNTASSGSGDIYFQLSAPTSYQWVGLGIGEQMAGASIFVIYADGNGNVTISPRSGVGHVEPEFDSSLQVELLEGSGINNGMMTANVLCTSCSSKLSSTTSSSSSWICAWNEGDALNSASTSETIAEHGSHAMRVFSFDLTKAVESADVNPFVTGGAATPTSGGSSDDNGAGASEQAIFNEITDYQKAHGIIMAVTVVLLFPIGAILMRVGVGPWVHGLVQIFSLAVLLCGFGAGVKLADIEDSLYKGDARTHTIFGTVLIALFLIQPFIGLLHHRSYLRTQKRGVFSYTHQWYGRILMLLAVINGGLGLKLADNSDGGKIAFGVVAGVVGVIYIAIVVLTGLRKRRDAAKQERSSI